MAPIFVRFVIKGTRVALTFGQQYNLIINNIFIDLKMCRILYIITNGEFIIAVASISISKESNLIDLRVLSNNYNKNNNM